MLIYDIDSIDDVYASRLPRNPQTNHSMMMTVRLVKQLVFGCAVVVVGGLSLLPQEVLPETGVWDKLEHAIAYAALCVIGAIAYPRKLARSKLLLGLVLYGVALEALQSFVPGRVASIADVTANTLGVVVGFMAVQTVKTAAIWMRNCSAK